MNQSERKPVIEFEHFQFQYFSQAEPTLYDINLKIYEGEKVLIVGPSGSGKSTMGNCLNGLIPFSYKGEIQGSLKISGRETSKMNIFELSKKVGTVLQDADGQFIGLTVGEDIAFALEKDCVPLTKMKETVQKVADIVEKNDILAYIHANQKEKMEETKNRLLQIIKIADQEKKEEKVILEIM